MTALDLYKFIEENEVEIDWRGSELVIWLHPYDIRDFTELIGYSYFSECGHDAILQFHNIALDIVPICEHFGIEPTDICKKED